MLASLAVHAIPLAALVLPTILSGLITGLLSGGINKAIICGGDVGDGLSTNMINAIEYRNGHYLAPHFYVLLKVLDCS